MDYKRLHDSIINKALSNRILHKDTYTEKHHIIPKCMGGSNKKENLVILTGKEHFIIHWLLYKIYKTSKLAHAWNMMSRRNDKQQGRYTSRSFVYAKIAKNKYKMSEETKKKLSLAARGKTLSIEHKEILLAANRGKVCSEEKKAKISKSQLGKIHSIEARERMSKSRTGRIHSAETKKKMSDSHKGKPKIITVPRSSSHNSAIGLARSKAWAIAEIVCCPYCNMKSRSMSNMKRYHFDNCKNNKIQIGTTK